VILPAIDIPVTVEPRRTMLPPSPSLADLCREAALLLDRYDDASGTAIGCTATTACPDAAVVAALALRPRIAASLDAIDDEVSGEEPGQWWARARLVEAGIVAADAWSVELLRLAAEWEGERSTEPEVVSHG
jgi:hypothetical protein